MRRRDRSPPRLFQSNLVCNTRLTIENNRQRKIQRIFFKMSLYITGFIVALVLALLVIAWIAYCMFVREKHKSEFYHHNIGDLQRRNAILAMNEETTPEKKDMSVGVFVLPSRHKQKDESYDKRPDYPESPVPVSHPSTDKLIDILNDGDADVHYRDGIYEIDSPVPYHSEV